MIFPLWSRSGIVGFGGGPLVHSAIFVPPDASVAVSAVVARSGWADGLSLLSARRDCRRAAGKNKVERGILSTRLGKRKSWPPRVDVMGDVWSEVGCHAKADVKSAVRADVASM